ncbi:uncharacterized protein LOC130945576 [Arachis stenosperma]|uniref:uncharacterized protein LOC130945576 n=1 Tax=Arachis stenosperma TaxID=217475 RepID=UPI0025AD14AA|nr:uncharacterized protein LOC130945576 [Arachis stenosperma]
MLGLLETKKASLAKSDVVQLWANDAVSWEFVGAEEASGGLLLMWDEMVFKMDNCYKGDRCLCVKDVLVKNNLCCAFCLVYGAHAREEKLLVWEELSFLSRLCQAPLCYLGDFNEVTQVEDRKGATALLLYATEFKSWIQDIELVNLALTDHKFTWFRGQLCSHIDQVLVSLEWLEEFPKTILKGGPRGLSDHYPLIIDVTRVRRGPRPFRSLNS